MCLYLSLNERAVPPGFLHTQTVLSGLPAMDTRSLYSSHSISSFPLMS